MPGLISNMFDPGEESASNTQATTIEGDGATGIEASPSVALELSGSHQNADGSTTDWSNTTEVGTDIDLDAAVATSTTLLLDDASG